MTSTSPSSESSPPPTATATATSTATTSCSFNLSVPPRQYWYLGFLGFTSFCITKHASKLTTKEDVAKLTKDDLVNVFKMDAALADIIISRRDGTLYEEEGWGRFYAFLCGEVTDCISFTISDTFLPQDSKERTANGELMMRMFLETLDPDTHQRKTFSDTFEKQFCDDLLREEREAELKKAKEAVDEIFVSDPKKEDEIAEVFSSSSSAAKPPPTFADQRFDRLKVIFAKLYNLLQPNNELSLAQASIVYCRLADMDKSRCDRNYSDSYRRPMNGRWTVCDEAVETIIEYGKTIANLGAKSTLTLTTFLEFIIWTIISNSKCRDIFSKQAGIRDIFLEYLCNPAKDVIPDGHNRLVYLVSRAYWMLIANHSTVQTFFCNETREVRDKTVAAQVYLGSKISIEIKELTEDQKKIQKRREIGEAIRKKRDLKEDWTKESQELEELENSMEHILMIHEFTQPSPQNRTKEKVYAPVYEYILLQYCVTEYAVDLRKEAGSNVEYRKIFERIGPVLDKAAGAEWFFQTLTHIVETPEGGKNFGTQRIREILYGMKDQCTYDNISYYYFACLCKLAKQTKESQALFGSIEIRDAFIEIGNSVTAITKPATAQWLFTAVHRMNEGSKEQGMMWGTQEFCAMAAKVGRHCTTDLAVRWWGMAVGTVLTLTTTAKIKENFGASDALRETLIFLAKYIEEGLTIDWHMSILQKLFQSDKMVLGRFCTEEMRDAIALVGSKCKVQKSKEWVAVVRDLIKTIPSPPTNPTAPKKHGKYAGKICMDDDLDENEANADNDDDEDKQQNKSTLAWVKKPIKF